MQFLQPNASVHTSIWQLNDISTGPGRSHTLQMSTQVLHCVMYPRIEYDLPILSFDMVGKHGRVSLVCIDPCPVSQNRSLPGPYISLVR